MQANVTARMQQFKLQGSNNIFFFFQSCFGFYYFDDLIWLDFGKRFSKLDSSRSKAAVSKLKFELLAIDLHGKAEKWINK